MTEPEMKRDKEELPQQATAGVQASRFPLEDLQGALTRLDRLLAEAVLAAQSAYGLEAAQDPYRGLYISADEVSRLLRREPAEPILSPQAAREAVLVGQAVPVRPRRFTWLGSWFSRKGPVPPLEPLPPAQEIQLPAGTPLPEPEDRLPLVIDPDPASPLGWLAQAYQLSSFDLDVLLIALAPELDLRYERLYAYLQDDVSRRRPSIDLALNLLCASAEEKAARRAHFSPGAPLLHRGLLQLSPDREEAQPPLLSHFLKLDGQIVRFLLGERTLDPRLAPFTKLVGTAALTKTSGVGYLPDDGLLPLIEEAWEDNRPLRLYFHGQPGSGRLQKARWLAAMVDAPLLVVDLHRALAADRGLDWVPSLIFREALFHNSLIYLQGFEALRSEEAAAALRRLWETLVQDRGITFLDGVQPWVPVGGRPGGVISIALAIPGHIQRRDQWEDLLAEAGVELEKEELESLADRFRLSPGQIADACATALNLARLHEASRPGGDPATAAPDLDDLFAAARAQAGHELGSLARKIEPLYRWKDIVLPEDTLQQLREICQRVAHGGRVLEDWGFDHKLSLGKGTAVLFAGPSGTGKTMAAEILAAELGLDLYKIDLSSVVSKYIGETEKNLERIFRAAENSNAILFFDEADALFGKRSEVRDSHDRYANIEISYLLQKMEIYDGIAILATNLRQLMDDSFVRRMAFTVSFPFPNEASRRAIWEGIWPEDTPRDFTPAELDSLAARFKFSGGNIKNVALAAAFLAAEDGTPVNQGHLLRAVQREYQKMGKTLTPDELAGAQKERVA